MPDPTKPQRTRKIDVAKAIRLRAKGRTFSEIGKHFGTTKSAIHHSISPLIKSLLTDRDYKTYQDNQAKMFDSLAVCHIENAMDPAKIKKTSAYQSAGIAALMTDKSLLIQGRATQNIDIRSMILHTSQGLSDADKALQVVLKQLADIKDK